MTDSASRIGAAAASLLLGLAAAPAMAATPFSFNLVRSAGLLATCAPNATARVTDVTQGFAEKLTIQVSGFKSGTKFDVFVIQVPNKPFGVAWYLGDHENGATHSFVSRLNDETFAVAVGAAPAPRPHGSKDAPTNPVFAPVHTFHLGIWFNSPADAVRNGCPNTLTPFNGEHTAGVQVLNSGNFPNNFGPLRHVS